MGQQENSNAAVIAVVLIGGLLVLFLVGGLVLFGGLIFVARSAPMPQQVIIDNSAALAPSVAEANDSVVIVNTDEDGAILIDGLAHTDDEFRELLANAWSEFDSVQLSLDETVDGERRDEILTIFREVQSQQTDSPIAPEDPAPGPGSSGVEPSPELETP